MLKSVWINFQKRNEYNPEHTHFGSDLSFVIYLKIPHSIREEYNSWSNRDKGLPPGCISFSYGEKSNFCINGRNAFPQENTIFIFPSYVRHAVSHFESDCERISVAGNIAFIDERIMI